MSIERQPRRTKGQVTPENKNPMNPTQWERIHYWDEKINELSKRIAEAKKGSLHDRWQQREKEDKILREARRK